jgi:hypothetical protein
MELKHPHLNCNVEGGDTDAQGRSIYWRNVCLPTPYDHLSSFSSNEVENTRTRKLMFQMFVWVSL